MLPNKIVHVKLLESLIWRKKIWSQLVNIGLNISVNIIEQQILLLYQDKTIKRSS